MREFFGCYLLESRHPRGKGRTYVGFTVNPRRRLRQHTGEIANGACKTKGLRPWYMVLVVYGFPTQVQALQFEWAWQHPEKSLDVRGIAARLGRQKRHGVGGKVLLVMEMLRAEPWCYYPLTLQFLSSTHAALRGRCPPPPAHMQVLAAPMEALPEAVQDAEDPAEEEEEGSASESGSEGEGGEGGSLAQPSLTASAGLPVMGAPSQRQRQQQECELVDLVGSGGEEEQGAASHAPPASQQAAGAAAAGDGKAKGKGSRAAARAASACMLCGKAASRTWVPCNCGVRTHVECLARHFLGAGGGGGGGAADPSAVLLPQRGTCPSCGTAQTWMQVLASTQNVGWEKHKPRKRGGKQGGGGGDAAAQSQQEQQQQQTAAAQGSPTQSAAAPGRKPRGRKPAAAAAQALAAAAGGGVPAAAAPPKQRGRPRKLQPVLGLDDGSEPSSSSWLQDASQLPSGSAAQQPAAADKVYALEALPWDDFRLASPPGTQAGLLMRASPGSSADSRGSRGSQRWQQQQQGQAEEVVVIDEEMPLAQRLVAQQWLRDGDGAAAAGAAAASPQLGAASAPPAQAAATPGPAAAAGAPLAEVDLVSPSPLPLAERLRRQQQRGAHSPRATPSPAPQRKLQRRFAAGEPAGLMGDVPAEPDVIVISDSD